jgi:hypothetical protein
MRVIYEWEQTPPPEGLVSVVVRLSHAEAEDLATGGDSAAVGEAVAAALQAAVADGSLVLP